jgi:hypothetical protein
VAVIVLALVSAGVPIVVTPAWKVVIPVERVVRFVEVAVDKISVYVVVAVPASDPRVVVVVLIVPATTRFSVVAGSILVDIVVDLELAVVLVELVEVVDDFTVVNSVIVIVGVGTVIITRFTCCPTGVVVT